MPFQEDEAGHHLIGGGVAESVLTRAWGGV